MNFINTDLPGVLIIEPEVFRDDRGFFYENYHKEKFLNGGLSVDFVQDNHSRSVKGTLRGLHLQLQRPQGKLIRVVRGEIFDVAVDVRLGSHTYKKWVGVRLSESNFRMLYVPPGFAHGFYVVSDVAEVEYKCTSFYDKADEAGVIWNDPEIAIQWPGSSPLLSPKDMKWGRLADVASAFAKHPAYHL